MKANLSCLASLFSRSLLSWPLAILCLLVMGSTLEAVNLKTAAAQIDRAVKTELTRQRIKPNPAIDDLTFLRRIYLDTIGRIPTHQEFRSWQGQRKRNRDALIQELVNRPTYAGHQFNYWNDVLRAKDRIYLNYIGQALKTNMPYDEFVFNMLASKGSPYAVGNGAVGYYFRDPNMPLDNLSITTQVFLGTDMSCAQCHDDPFSDWTQMDFFQLSAFTSGMKWRDKRYSAIRWTRRQRKDLNSDPKKNGTANNIVNIYGSEVTGGGTGLNRLPHDYKYDDGDPHQVIQARTLFGANPSLATIKSAPTKSMSRKERKKFEEAAPGKDIYARKDFARWLTSKENPMFTKTIVNRMWHKTMGVPLIGPLTALEMDDWGRNPALSRVLVKLMKDLNYDLKRFEQILFMTRTYQSEMTIGDIEHTEKYAFQGPILKRLSATQLWDSLMVLNNEKLDQDFQVLNVLTRQMKIHERIKDYTPAQVWSMIPEGEFKNNKTFMDDLADGKIAPAGSKVALARIEGARDEKINRKKKGKKTQKGKKKSAAKAQDSKVMKAAVTIASNTGDMSGMTGMGRMGDVNGMNAMNQMGMSQRFNTVSKSTSRGKAMVRASYFSVPANPEHFIRQFGQSERLIADTDSTEASITQALTIMNGLVEEIAQNRKSSVMKRISSAKDDATRIRTAFEVIMTRPATSAEVASFKALLKRNKGNVSDLAWILMNNNEFKFKR